ncbi:hypothetical protein K504DRAFT_381221 [Pleomassaria siparia CBS 279.74]|uniref:DUF7962 domain-containing protein n=1 Tax=Pleomassaria siparia CBS 279.74 TaxID=1314801 RepID=A0A6G1K7F9_9PLEO|nr:hypothetical protein K504DRAFT_381221 [Pleomassaria siparia CBS 279.74]
MLPRPVLTSTFALPYRKIPVLAIGRQIYCDTSLIIEALEHYFPVSAGWGTVYPKFVRVDDEEWVYKGLARGFASFWVDRPLFRTTTGLVPSSVWYSPFGTDRSQLIGHTLSPSKLAAKVPANLSYLDLHLSLLEPTLKSGTWVIPTPAPSLADLSLYYQLRWGTDIAQGKGVYNLTGGNVEEGGEDVVSQVWNEQRYPGTWKWFHAFEAHIASLPDLETTVPESDTSWISALQKSEPLPDHLLLVPAAVEGNSKLDTQRGLVPGVAVSVAPDDTGRDDPTLGTLVKIGVEEVVIKTKNKGEVDVRIHLPRLGFTVKIVDRSRL